MTWLSLLPRETFEYGETEMYEGETAGGSTATRVAPPGGPRYGPPPAETCETLEGFAFDKDNLTPDHQARLQALAQTVAASQSSRQPVRSIRIVGHTDPVGSAQYNLTLGQRRAEQVGRQLRATLEGLRPGIVQSLTISEESRGESEPVGTDAARNRRVQVCLTRPAGPKPPPPSREPNRWRRIMGPGVRAGNKVTHLVDGPETFRAMAAAIRTATQRGHYIYLLGWWLDDDVPLVAPYPPLPGNRLGPVAPDPNSTIRALFANAARQGVQVRAMLWDQTGKKKNTAEVARIQALPGGAALLDNNQLRSWIGSQHQKVLIVKGSQGLIAFCGGVDINWDRVQVKAPGGSSSGSSSSGGGGNPMHDVHCRIEGPGARDLLNVFIQRWFANPKHRALDRSKGALLGLREPLPAAKGRQFVRVGRTFNGNVDRPSGGTARAADRSVQDIFLKAIQGAQRYIYIEDQYLVSLCAADALNAALPRIQHLTIVIPDSSITDMPQVWQRRQEFIRRVARGPHANKVHIYILVDPKSGRIDGFHTYVHAKMMIVDDEVAIIGSANMNRRGWESDAEVAAAIFDIPAGGSARPFAQRLRLRLWSEHLNLPESRLLDPIASARLWAGPLPGKRVRRYNPTAGSDSWTSRRLSWDGVIDPPAPSRTAPCCTQFGQSCGARAS